MKLSELINTLKDIQKMEEGDPLVYIESTALIGNPDPHLIHDFMIGRGKVIFMRYWGLRDDE